MAVSAFYFYSAFPAAGCRTIAVAKWAHQSNFHRPGSGKPTTQTTLGLQRPLKSIGACRTPEIIERLGGGVWRRPAAGVLGRGSGVRAESGHGSASGSGQWNSGQLGVSIEYHTPSRVLTDFSFGFTHSNAALSLFSFFVLSLN